MESFQLDEQNVLHCTNCGCSFFAENGINRITLTTAQILANDKKIDEISVKDKLCPKDQEILKPMQTDLNDSTNTAIPSNVTLFLCSTCKGVFVYPDDLLNFKKAQEVKVDYFKLWGIPLPSVRSVAIISIVLFVSVISFTTFVYLQQQNISRIQAQDLIKNLYITSSNRYLFISFSTTTPTKSKILFIDKTNNQTIEKIIKGEPATYHQLTTSDVNIQDEIHYQIILIDERGNETKTEVKRLSL